MKFIDITVGHEPELPETFHSIVVAHIVSLTVLNDNVTIIALTNGTEFLARMHISDIMSEIINAIEI